MAILGKLFYKLSRVAGKIAGVGKNARMSFRLGRTSTTSAANIIAGSGAKAGAKLMTWGNLLKVTFVGGFAYFFFTGGLPTLLQRATGLPLWVCELIVAAVIVFVVLSLVRLMMYRFRRSMYLFKGQNRRY